MAILFLRKGAGSWVIPTALSVVAIKQFTVCNRSDASEKRIQLGVEMLLDRACVGAGWNSLTLESRHVSA